MTREPISSQDSAQPNVKRRTFIKTSSLAAGLTTLPSATADLAAQEAPEISSVSYQFEGQDSLCVDSSWESLNPGYWQVKNNALRRRLTNVGDRARSTGFPFHSANVGKDMQTDYDPSLPPGMIYRRDWYLKGEFELSATFKYLGDAAEPKDEDNPEWKMYQAGYGRMGIVLGAKSQFESYNRARHAVLITWNDDGQLTISGGGKNGPRGRAKAPALKRGQVVQMTAKVAPLPNNKAQLDVSLRLDDEEIHLTTNVSAKAVEGFVGLVAQGLIDFEVQSFEVLPQSNKQREVAPLECYACYPLGDTLAKVDGSWGVKFVSMMATDGKEVQIRVSDQAEPADGWEAVPVCGTAPIVNNSWRRNTAVVDVRLPRNPAECTLYYTVWKDGQNVTADSRIGTDSTGPGTGLVGDVPKSGSYVGRLPQLTAPYKICGLSCHAITSGLQQQTDNGYRMLGGGDQWQFRDQPTTGAYQHLEDYDFQIMLWEDDVWYMELVLYPPSTDDAYQIVKQSICGPTSRWQMMRHWNVINPGDHDYGMDDVKGPEQLAIRRVEGLGQDTSYMKRNFQIVHHLVTGAEEVDPLANPKKWRAWKMPDRDFTFVVLDSRLWRSSQDTDIWDDEGWGAFKNLYDRTDPTRSLLGEEQFAWLQELVATDSSSLICLTGINGMHTIWAGVNYKGGGADRIKGPFDQRDRVAADYAGWVSAGVDRVLELLGSREGIVSVYGDVHNGCIMTNTDHRVVECSFGPIGRTGGRAVIPGFGPAMKDFDGRDVQIHALYHKTHSNPELKPVEKSEPMYWNFLELTCDPSRLDQAIDAKIRNLLDAPQAEPRGGGELQVAAHQTGRIPQSLLPASLTILPNADVQILEISGRPLRGCRSDAQGRLQITGLPDVTPGTKLLVVAHRDNAVESKMVETLAIEKIG